MNKTQHLLQQVLELSKRYKQMAKLSGENFNIFKVIKMTTDEVKVHSGFIAELLDPKGSHGQDDKFLSLFVKQLEIKNFITESAKVEVEKSIGITTEEEGGRLDIYLEDINGRTIIIENKIYAHDQEKQLLRYYNFSNENLYYLNLWGEEPSEKSILIPEEDKKDLYKDKKILEVDKDFKIISYDTDILKWLKNCRKEAVQQPLLREGISHYINLIKYLTGQSNSEAMSKELVNLVTSSHENLESALTIVENLNWIKYDVQLRFWDKLKEAFKELKYEGLDIKYIEENVETYNSDKVWAYYNENKRKQYYGLWLEIGNVNGMIIHLGLELEDNIYFVLNINEEAKQQELFNSISKEINLKKSEGYETRSWRYPKHKIQFAKFNKEEIIKAIKNDFYVNEIIEEVKNYLNTIKKELGKLK